MGMRYNESADTFSFALVLLCLAVGDICYVGKLARQVPSLWYAQGCRPVIPALLDSACPDLAKLIGKFDGILGMGWDSITVGGNVAPFTAMVNGGTLDEPVFAFYLGDAAPGELVLGGVDEKHYTSTSTSLHGDS
jgi:hypothetical protein